MAWAHQAGGSGSASASSLNVTPTSGNALIVSGVTTSGSTTSVTFSGGTGGTWTTDKLKADAGDGNTLAVAHCEGNTNTNFTITTSADAGSVALITCDEYSGLGASSITDQSSSNLVGGAAYDSGTTPALFAAHEVVFGASYDSGGGGTVTHGTGFVARQSPVAPNLTEDADSGSGTSGVAASFNSTNGGGNKLAIVVVYKIPAAGATILERRSSGQRVGSRST
jgi:hypothetical protein